MTMVITLSFLGLEEQTSSSVEDDGHLSLLFFRRYAMTTSTALD
jgi:hypothetical protein